MGQHETGLLSSVGALMDPLLRRVLHLPTHLYRARMGWLLGHRFLLLIHTGRKSCLERRTVLEVLHFNAATQEAVVMSGFGRSSDWYLNIRCQPPLGVVIGTDKFVPQWRELTDDEAIVILANYEWRNRYSGPVVRRVLSRLAGWHYDGTDDARRRLVRALPLVCFSPSDNR